MLWSAAWKSAGNTTGDFRGGLYHRALNRCILRNGAGPAYGKELTHVKGGSIFMRKFGSLLAAGALAAAALALPTAAASAAAAPSAAPTLALNATAGPPVPVGDMLTSSLTPGSPLTLL